MHHARVIQHADHSLKIVDDVAVEPGDVIILPITTKRPASEQLAAELTADEKRLCRLNPDFPSWLIVSEFNADIWPNADLSLVPGTNRIDYGIARPGLMRRIGQEFRRAWRANGVLGIKR